MPIKHLEEIHTNAICGLWEITETAEELLDHITLTDMEHEQFQTFTNQTRRTHWLSYRALLKQMLPNESFTLRYDIHGKLHVVENTFQLSVSHSGKYSAAIIHRQRRVGIDIEQIADRIFRIKDRFLSQDELDSLPTTVSSQMLLVYWCAKETLYKYFGNQGFDFRTNLRIMPFLLAKDGNISGRILTDTISETIALHYRLMDGYILVYTAHER
jgi:phosphopantetheinyl transferase